MDRTTSLTPVRFQCGGALRSGSLYVERRADVELREALLRGEFCYVFAPRQIGKSSLRVRAERFLEERGGRCVSIDLTVIGTSGVTVDQWYLGLIDEIARGLGLDDPAAFWERHGRLSPVQRWSRYLRDEVLERIPAPVVIIICAVDAVLALPFPRDDFFASVRAMYNARADEPAWERLTFCLMGVASPGDLMQDAAQTPFNIGRGIRIEDFTRAEAEAFLPVLASVGLDAPALLEAVLTWTEGHPYMTQRICDAIVGRAERRPGGGERGEVTGSRPARGETLEDPDGTDQDTSLSAYDAGPTGGSVQGFSQSPPSDPGYARFRAQLSRKRVIRTMPELAIVARAVDEVFLRRGRFEDLTLSVAERYFNKENPSQLASPMLQLYHRLLEGEKVPVDGDDPVQLALLLTGMVAARREGSSAWLKVRNRIYASVFDLAWVREKQADRLIAEPLARWLQSGRSNEYVLRGRQLEEARAWAEGRHDLTPDEQAFLLAGLAWSRREEEVRREADLERELSIYNQERSRSQKRTIQILVAMVAVLMLLLGGFVAKYLEVERERLRATEAELEAQQAKLRVEEAIQAEREAWVKAEQARMAEQQAWKRAEEAITAARQASQGEARAEEARRDMMVKLRDAMTALDEARIKAEEAQQVAQGARAVSLARLPGWRNESLASGVRAVAPSFRSGRTPPAQAVEGLLEAVVAAGSAITLQGHNREVSTAVFAMNGSRVLTASADGTARMWDARTGRELSILLNYFRELTQAQLSPDGNRAAILSAGGQAWLQDLRSGTQLSALRQGEERVSSMAFSRDGSRLVTTSDDDRARIWDTSDGRMGAVLSGHERWIAAAAFSPDGARVVTASGDQTARLWEARTGTLIAKLEGHSGPLNVVAFSPDGARIATGSRDGTARLWDGETGRAVAVLEGHTDLLTSLVFSPDGSRLLTAGRDGRARLWDGRSGEGRRVLAGHSSWINAAAFSPDGRRIVTASNDATAKLWEVSSGRLLATFSDHTNFVNAAAFSPDGHQLVTAGVDRVARIYPASLEAFLAAACRVLADQPQLEPVRELCDASPGAPTARGE